MLVDTANILFRVAAATGKYNSGGTAEEQAGLAMHTALNTLNKFYKQIRPDHVAVTFEGAKNWRKAYTASDACVSKRPYKGNRVKDPSMEPFFELMKSFEELARNHTSLVCLSNPLLEGDDVFSGFIQQRVAVGDQVFGVSGDKDFAHMLKYPDFTLINPDDGKGRDLVKLCGINDAEYFMFEKAFRGDPGDNVMSAFPRVQRKRMMKAYTDEYERTKLMNETWTYTDPDTGAQTTFRVGDLWEENNVLMNLEKQPPEIRALMAQTVSDAIDNRGKFSFFHFTKFCGKFGLKQIAENGQQFAGLFSGAPSVEQSAPKRKSILEF
jgi:hypothetical protein